MKSSLDAILELTRDPDPVDERFVARVMEPVRSAAQRRSRRRRSVTRPAILGIAAVLVTSGAVAALVRSVAPERTPDVNVHSTQGTGVTGRGSSAGERSAVDRNIPTQAVAGDGASSSGTFRSNDLEWGYTSQHTSYVLDTRTGLRLETETYQNEVLTGRPHRITLTLANLGNRPIGVSTADGCALSVIAYHDEQSDGSGDPSAFRDPTSTKDPQRSNTWCAARGKEDPEKFVLKPGDVRTVDIRISLGRSGNWAVLGMCRCSYTGGSDSVPARPTPEKDAARELGRVGLDFPALPSPVDSQKSSGKRLFTPPIGVLAR